jgi:hypothetical protein
MWIGLSHLIRMLSPSDSSQRRITWISGGDSSQVIAWAWISAKSSFLPPHFFNIRLFTDSDWIGNMYMHDVTTEHGAIIVDRVQVPRNIEGGFMRLFKGLGEVFREMFTDVRYQYILMPFTISNHDVIQKAFNKYKGKLTGKWIDLNTKYSDHFESLQGTGHYYVLYEKAK